MIEINTSQVEAWDRRSCTASAFYSLKDVEDWIVALAEMIPGIYSGYVRKASSLDPPISYWSDCKEDKILAVSNIIGEIEKQNLVPRISRSGIREAKDTFYTIANKAARRLKDEEIVGNENRRYFTALAFAEQTCKEAGLTTDYIPDLCIGLILDNQLSHIRGENFFQDLAYLSRYVCCGAKERTRITLLDPDDLQQGIFEATHYMCQAQGGFLLSQNIYWQHAQFSTYFARSNFECFSALKCLSSQYLINLALVEGMIKQKLAPQDYRTLCDWVTHCRQRIVQSLKHKAHVNLWEICGPRQFVFADAENIYYQDASIALFIDCINQDFDDQLFPIRPKPKPQLLHMETVKELRNRPIEDRWQAIIEWVIEPIVPDRLLKEDFYPFLEGQSIEEQRLLVESIKKRDYRLGQLLPVPYEAQIASINLNEDAYTREFLLRQAKQHKANHETVRINLEAAKPNSNREEIQLTFILGNFQCTSLMEHLLREDIFYSFLENPPTFLTEEQSQKEVSSQPLPHVVELLKDRPKKRFKYIWEGPKTVQQIMGEFDITNSTWRSYYPTINDKTFPYEIYRNEHNLYTIRILDGSV